MTILGAGAGAGGRGGGGWYFMMYRGRTFSRTTGRCTTTSCRGCGLTGTTRGGGGQATLGGHTIRRCSMSPSGGSDRECIISPRVRVRAFVGRPPSGVLFVRLIKYAEPDRNGDVITMHVLLHPLPST